MCLNRIGIILILVAIALPDGLGQGPSSLYTMVIPLAQGPDRSQSDRHPSQQTEQIANLRQLYETSICNRCNLSNLDLRSFDLIGASLRWSDISNTDLTEADLVRADLRYVNFSGAVMVQSDLDSVLLIESNLADANLSSANLNNADLSRANLSNTNFQNADLADANLEGVILENTNFCGARLPDGMTEICE